MNRFVVPALVALATVATAHAQELPAAPQPIVKAAMTLTPPVRQPWATKRQWAEYAAVVGSELGDAYTTELCIHAHNGCHEEVLPLGLVDRPALMYSYSAGKAVGSIFLERRVLRTDMAKHHAWFREAVEIGQASHITMMVRQDAINWKAAEKKK